MYATAVATGRDGLGDPKKTYSTVRGTFKIREKHVTTTMDGDVASDGPYSIEDVPWVIVPSALGSFNEAHAVAALARPMTRIALGVPWFGPLGAHEVLAILVAFARQVAMYVAYVGFGMSLAASGAVAPVMQNLMTSYLEQSRGLFEKMQEQMKLPGGLSGLGGFGKKK